MLSLRYFKGENPFHKIHLTTKEKKLNYKHKILTLILIILIYTQQH